MAALTRGDDCVSDLAFDRWLSGSIEPHLSRDLEGHVQGCVRCSLRGETLAAQRAAFLARVPTWEALAAGVAGRERASVKPRSAAWRWLWSAGAALAACVVLALGPSLRRIPDAAATPFAAGRGKGAPHIGAYVKHGAQIARAESGDTVEAGDYLRFTYTSDVPVYFALLNRDARSAATYYPLARQTIRVAAGNDVALDFSIKLDGQPGSERVHGLFCDEPQDLEPLRAQLQQSGRLPPLPHCHVDVLSLTKGQPSR